MVSAAFGRRQTAGLLFGLSPMSLVSFALGMVIVFMLFMSRAGAVGWWGLAPLWLGLIAAAFVPLHGGSLADYAPTLVSWVVRRVSGQWRFRAEVMRPRPAGTMALPGDAAALQFVSAPPPDGSPGPVMVHDPWRQTLTAVVEVEVSGFVLLDPDAKNRRVRGYARLMDALASSSTFAACQVWESVIPDSGDGVQGWWRDHGQPDTVAGSLYAEAITAAGPAASRHRLLIAVTLDKRAARSEIRQQGRGVTGAARVLYGDIAALGSTLADAELRVVGWLAPDALAAFIRGAYDPADVPVAGDARTELASAGPVAVDEHWDFLRHDSGWSAVLWAGEWPASAVGPEFLHKLIFAAGVRRTVSIIQVPISPEKARQALRSERTQYETDRHAKQRAGFLIDDIEDAELGQVRQRARALGAGHADIRFAGLVVVTSTVSLEQLRADVAAVKRRGLGAGVDLVVLYGRQSQAFIAGALPLGRSVF